MASSSTSYASVAAAEVAPERRGGLSIDVSAARERANNHINDAFQVRLYYFAYVYSFSLFFYVCLGLWYIVGVLILFARILD